MCKLYESSTPVKLCIIYRHTIEHSTHTYRHASSHASCPASKPKQHAQIHAVHNPSQMWVAHRALVNFQSRRQSVLRTGVVSPPLKVAAHTDPSVHVRFFTEII